MPKRPKLFDYEPVTRPHGTSSGGNEERGSIATSAAPPLQNDPPRNPVAEINPFQLRDTAARSDVWQQKEADQVGSPTKKTRAPSQHWNLKRGHGLSYIGLFLFTLVVYVRPYELWPSLAWTSTSAFWIAILTLLAFIPAQLGLENRITADLREVNLLLLLSLLGILSVVLSIDRLEAWNTFVVFIKIVIMFIVMVNVVRTEGRLKGLLLLSLLVSLVISVGAINDFRMGRLKLGGVRIGGVLAGLFENPNDMALHLVTMIPIALAMMLGSRGPVRKTFYVVCALLMFGAVIVSFSRGGFLGLAAAAVVMAWKLRKRSRAGVFGVSLAALILFVVFLPSGYTNRLESMYNRDLDTGSVASRQDLLFRSLHVAARHPLLGIGMGNFHYVSIHEQVSHNAYTQIGAEIGLVAMTIYILFMIAPLKRMRAVQEETGEAARPSRFYYLAIGLQASLIGYMVSSFFASVAYNWYVYYLVGYAVCLERIYATTKARDEKTVPVASVASRLSTETNTGIIEGV